MASLVLGTAGAVAGFVLGGPTGAMIGWSIGAAIGGRIDNKGGSIAGQQLGDLRIMDSGYGNFIQKPYGAMRVAGSLIWAIDLVPVAHTTTSGGTGKGGGGGVTSTTYTYNATFAVSLCKGQISGLRRIWADGKLIYDARPGSTSLGALPITVYLGSPTQIADPTIQSYVGVANTPAYRDLAYVVFNAWDVSPYGNRIPSLTFEVAASGAATSSDSTRTVLLGFPNRRVFFAPNGNAYMTFVGSTGVPPYSTLSNVGYVGQINLTNGGLYTYAPTPYAPGGTLFGIAPDGRLIIAGYSNSTSITLVTPGSWNSQEIQASGGGVPTNPSTGPGVVNINGQTFYIGYTPTAYLMAVSYITGGATAVPIAILGELPQCIGTDGTYIYLLGTANWFKYMPSGALIASTPIATGETSFVITNGAIYAASSSIFRIRSLATLSATFTSGSVLALALPQVNLLEDGSIVVSGTNSTDPTYHFDLNGNLLSSSYVGLGQGSGSFVRNPITNECYCTGVIGSFGFFQVYTGRLTTTGSTLDTVVADICNQAGMATTDYDVTALASTTLDGFALNSQTDGASWIQQLMAAYFFDAVEHNGKLTFVKRGSASILTIPSTDLGAVPFDSQLPPSLQIDRTSEVELPKSIDIGYYNLNGDYLQSVQQYKRQVTHSQQMTQMSTQLALSDAHAMQIAESSMFVQHLGRTMYTFYVTQKYAQYEPTDVITVNGYTMRILSDDRGVDGTIRFVAIAEDPSIYGNPSAGGAANFPVQSVPVTQATAAMLLDIPQLRDQDQDPGFYAAAYAGNVTAWTGAVLYRSIDGGSTYQSEATISPPAATIGTCTTTLGTWTGGNIPDESNTLTVSVFDNTLASCTFDQVLQYQNLALVGNEIVSFGNVTLNANGTYTLSRFLRGRYGTDWAIGSHAANERFILLTISSVVDVVGAAANLNAAYLYKPVTIGGSLLTTPALSFTNTGIRLKPYAPVMPVVARDTSGNITITWVRRSRWGGIMHDGGDIPLGETSESYDVEIWTSGYATLKRTFAAQPSATCSYTSANQVTDFGSNQSTIYFRVYQNSSVIGRGYVLQAQG